MQPRPTAKTSRFGPPRRRRMTARYQAPRLSFRAFRGEESSGSSLQIPRLRLAMTGSPRLSPDLAPRLSNHRRTRAAAECLRELGHVHDRADGAELPERMLVRLRHEPRELGPVVRRPDPPVRHEETLV